MKSNKLSKTLKALNENYQKNLQTYLNLIYPYLILILLVAIQITLKKFRFLTLISYNNFTNSLNISIQIIQYNPYALDNAMSIIWSLLKSMVRILN